jgi:hypothetical protein
MLGYIRQEGRDQDTLAHWQSRPWRERLDEIALVPLKSQL